MAWSILLALAAVKVLLHALASGPLAYGLMTDELYYIDCSRRLDWGYVDHPPFAVFVLWSLRSLFGESMQVVRLGAALCGAGTILLTGAICRRMGGGRSAQGLAGLAVLAAPLLRGSTFTFTVNAVEILLWTAAAWIIVVLIDRDGRGVGLWALLGVALGLGLMTKVSAAWLCVGLAVGVLATRKFDWLRSSGPWLAAALAAAIYAPNLIWNAHHGWPMFEFLRNSASEKALTYTDPLSFVVAQLVVMGIPVWLWGLVYVFRAEGRRYRLLGWSFLTVFALLLLSGSAKPYYMAPAYPPLLAAFGVSVERYAKRPHAEIRGWCAALAIVGILAAPLTISLVPPGVLARYLASLGGVMKVDDTASAPLPQHFAQMFHGPAVTLATAEAWAKLSPAERTRAGILTGHFGEAGGINYQHAELFLPRAIGTHVSYWLWGPGDVDGELLLVVADDEQQLRTNWREVVRLAEIDCAFCMPELNAKSVYVVRGLRRPFEQVWTSLKRYF